MLINRTILIAFFKPAGEYIVRMVRGLYYYCGRKSPELLQFNIPSYILLLSRDVTLFYRVKYVTMVEVRDITRSVKLKNVLRFTLPSGSNEAEIIFHGAGMAIVKRIQFRVIPVSLTTDLKEYKYSWPPVPAPLLPKAIFKGVSIPGLIRSADALKKTTYSLTIPARRINIPKLHTRFPYPEIDKMHHL